jgi:hypothetical protein
MDRVRLRQLLSSVEIHHRHHKRHQHGSGTAGLLRTRRSKQARGDLFGQLPAHKKTTPTTKVRRLSTEPLQTSALYPFSDEPS